MGAARRRWRKHLIDVSRLLGYTIEPYDRKSIARVDRDYVVRRPDGFFICDDSGYVETFRYMWEAARHAIELEGLDAGKLKPGRDA